MQKSPGVNLVQIEDGVPHKKTRIILYVKILVT
jgi:hypothetical protein